MQTDSPYIQSVKPSIMHSAFLDAAPVIAFWKDREDRLRDVSGHCARLFGFNSRVDAEGCPSNEIPSHIGNYAAEERVIDREIMNNQQTLIRVTTDALADNKTRVYIKRKFPLISEADGCFGVGVFCNELDSKSVQAINNMHHRPEFTTAGKRSNDSNFNIAIDNTYTVKLGLSRRESETLYFLLRGYSASEIAKELGLSSKRTIEEYIIRIKSKLLCRTKREIIEHCFDNNLADIIPPSLLSHKLTVNGAILADIE